MILLKKKNEKWMKIVSLDKSYCIKCQSKKEFIKVLKFFEEHTLYRYDDTKEYVSSNREFSDDSSMYNPVYIITNKKEQLLYTSPIQSLNPSKYKEVYSTAFIQQMNVKLG